MPEKYFATIMKKTNVGDGDFVYKVKTVAAGDIDDKTKILKTDNGKTYRRIDDFTDFDSTTEYYANFIETDRITAVFEEKYSFADALKEYESRCKEIVYYVTKLPDQSYIMVPIDKSPYIRAIERIDSEEDMYDENISEFKSCEEYGLETENEEDPIIEQIKDLVCQIVQGKYSPDELIDLKYRLKEQMKEIEGAIQCIDLQCEALEDELDKISGNEPKKEKTSVTPPTPLNQKNTEVEIINVDDIFDKVTKVLVAQDKPARRVIVELSRLDRMRKKDYGILLTGESGVGKTLLMSLLGRHLNRPVLHIDSTQLTAPGFVGQSLEQKLWELYESCNCDLEKAEHAIVFFDEIDKKGSEKKTDISGQAVLNTLLKFLDGTSYTACKNSQVQTPDTTVKIDTSDMLVVVGGAFLDVYNAEKKKTIGFSSQTEAETTQDKDPSISDFIKKSMMTKEFMGRVPVIVHLNNLDVDSIRRILLESQDSALKLQEEVFADSGVKLTTKDGYILSIAKKALDEKIGARGLNKLITDTTWQAYDQVISNPGVYEEVILTEETVEKEDNFQLVKRKTKEIK